MLKYIGKRLLEVIPTTFGIILLTFVLFTRQLNAGQLSAITGIMVAARVFDALNDLLKTLRGLFLVVLIA